MEYDAIVVAGGGGTRMGGVRKADLLVGGRRLLDVVLDAVAGARQVVVVGRVPVPAGVLVTTEDPPGQGPAAGAAAGMAALSARGGSGPAWTLLLAVDLPGAAAAVTLLTTAAVTAPAEVNGFCLRDAAGRTQWLTGIHRSARLRQALLDGPPLHGVGIRSVLEGLEPQLVDAPETATGDIDTWEAYRRWQGPQQLAPERRLRAD